MTLGDQNTFFIGRMQISHFSLSSLEMNKDETDFAKMSKLMTRFITKMLVMTLLIDNVHVIIIIEP